MKEVIAKDRGHEIIFHHLKSDRFFGRIVAGIGLPGRLPGYACIFAEDRFKDTNLKAYHVHLLEEIEAQVAGELLRKLADLCESYEVSDIYGLIDDQNLFYLSKFNDDQQKHHRPTVYIQPPPYLNDESKSDRLEYYIRTLQDRLDPAAKSVHLGETSKLAGYLMQLPFNEIVDVRVRDYPAVAAAAYAVTAMTLWEKVDPDQLPDRYDTEYDSLAS